MGNVVNLKLARKRRERAERQKEADAKRILFGRTASESTREEMVKSLQSARLDAARRQRTEQED